MPHRLRRARPRRVVRTDASRRRDWTRRGGGVVRRIRARRGPSPRARRDRPSSTLSELAATADFSAADPSRRPAGPGDGDRVVRVATQVERAGATQASGRASSVVRERRVRAKRPRRVPHRRLVSADAGAVRAGAVQRRRAVDGHRRADVHAPAVHVAARGAGSALAAVRRVLAENQHPHTARLAWHAPGDRTADRWPGAAARRVGRPERFSMVHRAARGAGAAADRRRHARAAVRGRHVGGASRVGALSPARLASSSTARARACGRSRARAWTRSATKRPSRRTVADHIQMGARVVAEAASATTASGGRPTTPHRASAGTLAPGNASFWWAATKSATHVDLRGLPDGRPTSLPLDTLAVGDPAAPTGTVSAWTSQGVGPIVARVGPGTGGNRPSARFTRR